MTHQGRDKGKGAIQIIEEAIFLLRRLPMGVLFSYYIGSLPFVLGLLYFWADMSRSAFADRHIMGAAFGLALLFWWMKCWQAVFALLVKNHLHRAPAPGWTWDRTLQLTLIHGTIHATGLFILPVAFIIFIPFGWAFAFYQSVTAQPMDPGQKTGTVCKNAWHQAKLWPGQNHMVLSILSLFSMFVFLNLAVAVYGCPYILKKFLGVETLFTLSGLRVLFNTTFWATICALTYLCMDPIVKTVYALRCYYGSSLVTGEDLRSAFTLCRAGNGIPLILGAVMLSVCLLPHSVRAAALPVPTAQAAVAPQTLDRAIETVMNQREFTWRMPRDKVRKTHGEEPGVIGKMMDWLYESLKTGVKAVGRWIKSVIEWLEKFLPKTNPKTESSPSGTQWLTPVRILLIVLLVVLLGALLFLIRHIWKRGKMEPVGVAIEPLPKALDLADDRVKADDLPTNRWLDLARELLEKGNYLLALRAFYLATLAFLADSELLVIAKHKSNRDYELELRRRAHMLPDLISLFSENVMVFDRVWYGMRTVTMDDVDRFAVNQRRIMDVAAQ